MIDLPFPFGLPRDIGRRAIGDGAFRLLLDDLAGDSWFSLFTGLPTLILIFGIVDGELGVVAGSAASGDIGDLGDIIIGDKLRFMTCIVRLDGVNEPLGLSGA